MERPKFSQTVASAVNLILTILINAVGITDFNQSFKPWQSILIILTITLSTYLIVTLICTPFYALKMSKYSKILEQVNNNLKKNNVSIADENVKLQKELRKIQEVMNNISYDVKEKASFYPDNKALLELNNETKKSVRDFKTSTMN